MKENDICFLFFFMSAGKPDKTSTITLIARYFDKGIICQTNSSDAGCWNVTIRYFRFTLFRFYKQWIVMCYQDLTLIWKSVTDNED